MSIQMIFIPSLGKYCKVFMVDHVTFCLVVHHSTKQFHLFKIFDSVYDKNNNNNNNKLLIKSCS